MLKNIFHRQLLARLLRFHCLMVILLTSPNTLFAQKKLLPEGFPADCPLAQPLSKKEVNNSPARIGSDSLAKKAKDLVSQLNKENVLGAIAILASLTPSFTLEATTNYSKN